MAQRRSNGEGTKPYRTSDGRWRADYVVGHHPVTGRLVRKSVYAKTRALCADRLRVALRQVDEGIAVPGRVPTLQEWLDHWLYQIAEPQLRHNTFRGYESSLRKWVWGTRLASRRLDQITPEDFDSLYQRMREAGKRPATMVIVHRILSRALKVAVQRRRLGRSPLEGYPAPTGSGNDAYRPDVLSPADARQLIAAAQQLPASEGVGWMLALALGPRQGERLGLGWDMVDLDGGQVTWARSVYRRRWEHGCSSPQRCPAKNGKGHLCPQRTGGGLYFGAVKSSAGERVNALPQQLQGPLRELWQQHLDAGRPAYTDPAGVSVELVFPQPHGAPWQREQDLDRWHSFLAGAGVSPRRVHDQRHTTATVLLLLGVEPRTVMDLMGWSQLSMLTRYQHVLDEVRRDAGDRVGDALFGAADQPQQPGPVHQLQQPPQPPAAAQPAPVTSLDEWRARRAG